MSDTRLSVPPTDARSRSRTLVLAILAGVIVLAIVALGALAYRHVLATEPRAVAEPASPTFLSVAPMTVNLGNAGQVLYIGLSLAVADPATAARLEQHMPEVRNRMLITLSDQQADRLTTAEGKRQVAETLRKVLRAPYDAHDAPVAIQRVLFTNFIVQ